MVAALDDDAHETRAAGALRAAPRRAAARGAIGGFHRRPLRGRAVHVGDPRRAVPRHRRPGSPQRGILVAPGEFYGPRGAEHVRIALTATDERIAAGASPGCRLRASSVIPAIFVIFGASRSRPSAEFAHERTTSGRRTPRPEKAQRYRTEDYQGAVGPELVHHRPDAAIHHGLLPAARRARVRRTTPDAHRRADGRPGGAVGRGDRPQPATARTLRPVGPRRQPRRHADRRSTNPAARCWTPSGTARRRAAARA